MLSRKALFLVTLLMAAVENTQAAPPSVQQGPKLVGAGGVGIGYQGSSVALSSDGNTAIVGGPADNTGVGAAWVYTRSPGAWNQQGAKLVGTGAVGRSDQGWSVALSADGNTAMVGAVGDSGTGAAWVFTRSAGVWSQQGPKLVGSGAVGPYGADQGCSVALSADGNTAIVGGFNDNSSAGGAAWVFTRSGGAWSQQGEKLVGTGATPDAQQGYSVALSGDGNTALVGGNSDSSGVGAVWVFTRNGGIWSQQGAKLVGAGAVGLAGQGQSVALSGDGNTAMVGGANDDANAGAVWVFTRSGGGVWSQQGSKLVGIGAVGTAGQGGSVALSADGNRAIEGGGGDNSSTGATWVFTRSVGAWNQREPKLLGSGAAGPFPDQGGSVALSADGTTAIVGGPGDNGEVGAAWVFVSSGGASGVGGSSSGESVALALDPPANPARGGPMMISFSLPSGEPARLELVDVSGREVAVDEVGSLGAGRHTVNLCDGRRVPAGFYFVRLSQGSHVAHARVAVLQ